MCPAEWPIVLLQAAPSAQVASLRVLAAILLAVMICGLIYVLPRLKGAPAGSAARSARNNLIFLSCAIAFLILCVLLYLVARA